MARYSMIAMILIAVLAAGVAAQNGAVLGANRGLAEMYNKYVQKLETEQQQKSNILFTALSGDGSTISPTVLAVMGWSTAGCYGNSNDQPTPPYITPDVFGGYCAYGVPCSSSPIQYWNATLQAYGGVAFYASCSTYTPPSGPLEHYITGYSDPQCRNAVQISGYGQVEGTDGQCNGVSSPSFPGLTTFMFYQTSGSSITATAMPFIVLAAAITALVASR